MNGNNSNKINNVQEFNTWYRDGCGDGKTYDEALMQRVNSGIKTNVNAAWGTKPNDVEEWIWNGTTFSDYKSKLDQNKLKTIKNASDLNNIQDKTKILYLEIDANDASFVNLQEFPNLIGLELLYSCTKLPQNLKQCQTLQYFSCDGDKIGIQTLINNIPWSKNLVTVEIGNAYFETNMQSKLETVLDFPEDVLTAVSLKNMRFAHTVDITDNKHLEVLKNTPPNIILACYHDTTSSVFQVLCDNKAYEYIQGKVSVRKTKFANNSNNSGREKSRQEILNQQSNPPSPPNLLFIQDRKNQGQQIIQTLGTVFKNVDKSKVLAFIKHACAHGGASYHNKYKSYNPYDNDYKDLAVKSKQFQVKCNDNNIKYQGKARIVGLRLANLLAICAGSNDTEKEANLEKIVDAAFTGVQGVGNGPKISNSPSI